MAYISGHDASMITSDAAGFSAILVNALSLRKNYIEISAFLGSFDCPFSIIGLSETWISAEDKDLYGLSCYSCKYCHRDGDPYGGSAIYVLNGLSYTRRHDLNLNIPKC